MGIRKAIRRLLSMTIVIEHKNGNESHCEVVEFHGWQANLYVNGRRKDINTYELVPLKTVSVRGIKRIY